ncbi:MAG: integration host factor, partial [Chloroflexi bacterium]
MQKTDFIKAVAERAKVSQKETKQIIDAALEVITEALARGE